MATTTTVASSSTATTATTTTTTVKEEEKKASGKQMMKEDLSRMEGTYGKEVIGKLKKLKVLIIGLRGVGIETAKNLILAGPAAVDLHDDCKCSVADLGCNFYLTQEDVKNGTPRAQAVVAKFQELNPNVDVQQHTGQFERKDLDKYDVVVCCDDRLPEQALKDFNNHCRNRRPNPITFMVAHIQGPVASVFTDFGSQHTVLDANGEPTRTLIIDSILNNQDEGRVTIDGERHLLSNGDQVKFTEVIMADSKTSSESIVYKKGDTITDINQTHVIKTTKKPNVFTIGSTRGLGEYKGGGIAVSVKVAKKLEFHSFEDELKNPSIIDSYMDFTKFGGRAQQLHFGRLALYEFLTKHDRVPNYHSEEDAKQVIELAKEINEKHKKLEKDGKKAITVDQVDEKVMRQVSLYAKAEISPMAALFGGVVAQEIIKHTGKYTPVKQWLHFDAFEILQDKVPADAVIKETRYDHQVAMFGQAWQDAWMKKNVFIVGCGALGCEYLKFAAMTGLGCGAGGQVTCTDDDTIELSNLSRQFLFRRKHVNKEKSTSAGTVVTEMNGDLKSNLRAECIRVEPKTEDTFNDTFWEKLDFVVNALDNLHARKYIDSKCVIYGKPLFESGTLGTKANNVLCLPGLTPSYSEGVKAGEGGGIAKCTLRNFPSLPLHCIEWAREMFDEMFVLGPDVLSSYLKDKPAFFEKLASSPMEEYANLKLTKKWIDLATNPSVEKCAKEMFNVFLASFRDKIKLLIHHFPEDARNIHAETKADLGAFWHGHKRFPQFAEWSVDNDVYFNFVYHSTCILANQIFGLKIDEDESKIKEICRTFEAPEWKFTGDSIDLSGAEDKKDEDKKEEKVEIGDDDVAAIAKLKEELEAYDSKTISPVASADFEKDDDKNHHIDIIASGTNLRSWNYKIKESSTAHVRMIAGKIIPAIATTTACITGFIGLEVMKNCANAELEAYRMATINLAVNAITMELLPDPIRAKSGLDKSTYMQMTAVPEGFTTWDFVKIEEPDLTLGQFIEHFKKIHHGCMINLLGTGKECYYMEGVDGMAERMDQKLHDVVVNINGAPIHPADRNYIIFDCVGCTTPDDDEGNVPKIKWIFK